MSAADVRPASAASSASYAWTSEPIARPRAVLAALAEVAPVPPSLIARVPVMLEAARSTASLLDSMTRPPLALASTATVTALSAIDVATPSPPAISNTSLSRSIAMLSPESADMSRSEPPT